MNTTRRALILAGGAAAIPASMGCFSAALVAGSTATTTEYYEESVSSVLISGDQKTLVVIGEKYHYLFDAPSEVKAVLQQPFGEFVVPVFQNFQIEPDQKISGHLVLSIAANTAPPDAQAAAQASGFQVQKSGKLEIQLTLKGKRYASGGIKASDARQQLRKPFKVSIGEPKGPGIRMAGLLLTPITLAIDGVLILVVLPLALLFKS